MNKTELRSLIKEEIKKVLAEGNAAMWTKQQLDRELKELQAGAQESGYVDDSMAFDIADGWIRDNPGVDKAIKKHYPRVTDIKGFVANYIA